MYVCVYLCSARVRLCVCARVCPCTPVSHWLACACWCGAESSLLNCSHTDWTTLHGCDHSYSDVALVCSKLNDVRLVNGRVEVQLNGTWGTVNSRVSASGCVCPLACAVFVWKEINAVWCAAAVVVLCVCAQGLTSLGAVVLCGSLGYENGDVLAGPVPPGSGPIAITDLSCSGQGALPRSHTRA